MQLGYSVYPDIFYIQVRSLLLETKDTKVFAMCAEYMLQNVHDETDRKMLHTLAKEKLAADESNPILQQLWTDIDDLKKDKTVPSLHRFLLKDYLKGNVLMISFQRRNRDYPGLVLIRDANGHFMKSANGFFCVPQLARSLTNMPGYLTSGNTPEGIFRMDGFDVSKSNFIGPTANIQLTMPFEYKASHFFNDVSLNDSTWNIAMYQDLLPANFKNYHPAFQSFFAGKAGRTAIIAHGTTVNTEYYKGLKFYPLTPTEGCLCTKEIWSEENGKLVESDQQKLVDTIISAGGPYGYAIVINIDDKQEAVTIADILPYLTLAGQ